MGGVRERRRAADGGDAPRPVKREVQRLLLSWRDGGRTIDRRLAMTLHRPRIALGAALALAAALITGCATPPRNTALEDARVEVARARADASVATTAPEALRAAEDALARADILWEQWGDQGEVARLAALARDRALLAQDISRQRLATARLEAEEARARAAAAQAQAAQAQVLAEEARARAAAAAAAAQAAQPNPLPVADPRAQLESELRARAARPGPLVVTLDETMFDAGGAILRSDAVRTLAAVAVFLRDHPERLVLVEGFTRAPGSYALSQQRTLAVREALLARGVSPRRIEVRPLGSGRALRPGEVAPLERVEVVISDPAGRLAPR
jgi:outer membrane protein OmpA-like peptidoglycan-associated protein